MNIKKQIKTNKEIIDKISKIVEPHMKFNMDDIYGDRGGHPYPQIEELDILYFKYNYIKYFSTYKENELIIKIKELELGEVDSYKIDGKGKFMVIKLDKYNKRIINQYNDYLDYKNKNIEEINYIYQYLEEKIPEEFIGWVLYSEK
jgi:hypothetical protein